MKHITENEYKRATYTMQQYGQNYCVDQYRGNKWLVCGNGETRKRIVSDKQQKILTANLNKKNEFVFEAVEKSITKDQTNSFFALVSKSVTKYIVERYNYDVPELPDFCEKKIFLDHAAYCKLPVGEWLIEYDICSAWWQAAFAFGIITETIYDKYMDEDDYQRLRQMSFGLTTSCRIRQYYFNEYGKIPSAKPTYEIHEVKNLQKLVYQNIRYLIHNEIMRLFMFCRDNGITVYRYTQDSILIKVADRDLFQKWIHGNTAFIYSICCFRKESDDSYSSDSPFPEITVFKKYYGSPAMPHPNAVKEIERITAEMADLYGLKKFNYKPLIMPKRKWKQ